jgi:ceramide glucosyltransferase
MLWLIIRWALLLFALAPFFYYLGATIAALRFFRCPASPAAAGNFTPPVSILKPVRGLDRDAYENFASFARQDYPEFEILFNVADDHDPAIPVIQKLITDFPLVPIRLFTGCEQLGTCQKVNKLVRLAGNARHDLLVISDSDIRVDPDYLRAVSAPFQDPAVGLVTCLYRGLTPASLAAELEAIGISSDFDAGVLSAWQLGDIDFALGATMATTKARVAAIGGWRALVNFFCDDYELGNRIARSGYRVELSPYPVCTVFSSQTLGESFRHQVRWNLSLRYSRPLGHFGLIVTHGLPWAILAAAIAPSAAISVAYLVAYLLFRSLMAWTVGVRGVGDQLLRRRMWLLPIRDVFAFAVWVASFFHNRIEWRGSHYTIRDKQLVPVETPAASSPR